MRKIFAVALAIMSVACFTSCASGDKAFSPFGIYRFERVAYLSPLSSSMPEFVNKQMAEANYSISRSLFRVAANDHVFEVKAPMYIKEKVSSASIVDHSAKWQYTILDENKQPTHFRLYFSTDNAWIAQYADSTADSSEIIMYVYKLTRQ